MYNHITYSRIFNKENVFFHLIILTIALLLISSFIVPKNTFIGPYLNGPKLWFYLSTGILQFIIALYLLTAKNYRMVNINGSDILIGITLLYVLLRQLTEGKDIFFTDKLVSYVYLTFVYFIIKFYLTSLHPKNLKRFTITLTLILITTTIISTTLGLLQFYGFITFSSYVTGQFKGPAPYANFLIAILPFCFAAFFLYPPTSKWYTAVKYLSLIALITGFLVLPVTYTRAAWIGIIAGISFILFCKYNSYLQIKNTKKTLWISAIGVIIATVLLFGLYQLKPRSADGRLLVWKVSAEIIKQHPLIGIGYGNFEGQYNSYQAIYFATGDSSPQEIELADKVFYSYNVFIQILAEQGIIGFILFAALLFTLFRSAFNSKIKNSYSRYLITGSAAAILSIISCGQFSYPFDILPVFIIFFISMALVSGLSAAQKSQKKKKSSYTLFVNYIFRLSGILFLAGSLFIFYYAHEKYIAYSNWKMYTSENQTSDMYSKIYPVLKKDANFRAKYGKLLLDEKKYEDALQVLEDACYYMSDPFIYINLAQAYIALKDYKKAEKAFIFAANMIPNRLYSKYLLAKFYFETERKDEAKALSKIILATTPKIMSPAIEEMKADIRERMSANLRDSLFIKIKPYEPIYP